MLPTELASGLFDLIRGRCQEIDSSQVELNLVRYHISRDVRCQVEKLACSSNIDGSKRWGAQSGRTKSEASLQSENN
jgi:hypothetical protein